MTQNPRLAPASDRLNFIERREGDFPFYNGAPVRLGWGRWLFLLGAVALGFATLIAPLPLFADPIGGFIAAILFSVIPLAALALVAGRHWTALFRRPTIADLKWTPLFIVVNLGASAAVAMVVQLVFGAAANPATSFGEPTFAKLAAFYPRTGIQLVGEEVLTILPFLAVLWLAYDRFGLSRPHAIVAAWLVSALPFALVHLPTYQWNWAQCLLVIGTARLVLTLPYILTKNLWAAVFTHVLYDWMLFTFVIVAGGPGIHLHPT